MRSSAAAPAHAASRRAASGPIMPKRAAPPSRRGRRSARRAPPDRRTGACPPIPRAAKPTARSRGLGRGGGDPRRTGRLAGSPPDAPLRSTVASPSPHSAQEKSAPPSVRRSSRAASGLSCPKPRRPSRPHRRASLQTPTRREHVSRPSVSNAGKGLGMLFGGQRFEGMTAPATEKVLGKPRALPRFQRSGLAGSLETRWRGRCESALIAARASARAGTQRRTGRQAAKRGLGGNPKRLSTGRPRRNQPYRCRL